MFRTLSRLLAQLTARFRMAFLAAVSGLIARLVTQIATTPMPAYARRGTPQRRGRVIDGEAHRI